MRAELPARRRHFGVVVLEALADEAARGGTAQRAGDSRVLGCLVQDLQQQPRLWVHPLGLGPSHPEEAGVEAGHVVEEGAVPAIGSAVPLP